MDFRIIETGTDEYEKMASLRMKVLLDPIGVPRFYIDPVKEAADLLIGAFEADRIIGCCILTAIDNATMQLRQMAVDTEIQGKGVGAGIIRFAEELAKKNGYRLLMMHARDVVIPFYQKCGYHVAGEQFFEVGIGHHRMEKEL
jgi:predicted GNAT family N-acyltransferase